MTYTFEFERLVARLRAPLLTAIVLAFTACDSSEPTEPVGAADPVDAPEAVPADAEAAAEPIDLAGASVRAYQGGIPFGFFRQPNSALGVLYSGAKQTMGPNYILKSLRETKARGGKVFLMLADSEKFYKTSRGHFDFNKWKARVDRYKRINIEPYINDGTIIAHFLMDEPQDKANWNGKPVTGAQIEAMAAYSKRLWPRMATIIRAPPAKIKWSGRYRALDAAWAQVENVRGNLNINSFLSQNIASAKSQGLALAVGLNVTKGNRNRTRMTPAQIRSWGSTLLASSYPCAFISWMYSPIYARGAYGDALRSLRSKAQNRGAKSCRSS